MRSVQLMAKRKWGQAAGGGDGVRGKSATGCSSTALYLAVGSLWAVPFPGSEPEFIKCQP